LPGSPPAAVAGLRLDQLTAREVTILDAIARGLSNGEIGRELNIREKTVRNQVSAILGKLGLVSRSQAIVRARETGLGRSPASR
jgi:DNA-binding NarL/FixJ family response regulator